ncbi:hypothetical protein ABID80_002133 [Streptomyces sp. PvP037]
MHDNRHTGHASQRAPPDTMRPVKATRHGRHRLQTPQPPRNRRPPNPRYGRPPPARTGTVRSTTNHSARPTAPMASVVRTYWRRGSAPTLHYSIHVSVLAHQAGRSRGLTHRTAWLNHEGELRLTEGTSTRLKAERVSKGAGIIRPCACGPVGRHQRRGRPTRMTKPRSCSPGSRYAAGPSVAGDGAASVLGEGTCPLDKRAPRHGRSSALAMHSRPATSRATRTPVAAAMRPPAITKTAWHVFAPTDQEVPTRDMNASGVAAMR